MPILFPGKTDPWEIQYPLLTSTIKKHVKNAGALLYPFDSVEHQVILMDTKILEIHLFLAKKNSNCYLQRESCSTLSEFD